MTRQARSSAVIMGLDTHMILETVPVLLSTRQNAHPAINRTSRHYAGALAWWVRHSKYGLALLAIRDDEDRALGLGVHVTSTKLSAYVLSALFVGVAGGLYVPFVGSVYPQFAFDPTFDLASTVMVFVGGIGTLAGPVVGVLLLEPLQQYLELQFGAQNLFLIIYAALFIVILRLLPGGIVPGIADRW